MAKNLFIITIITFFVIVNCKYDILPTDELKFLGEKVAGPGDVQIIENCDNNPAFVNTRTKVTPMKIEKGGSIDIKVVGQDSKQDKMQKIEVVAFLNGVQSFTDIRPFTDDVKPGANVLYEYTTQIPSFIPQGRFEIYLRLVNKDNEKVSCLKAYFDF